MIKEIAVLKIDPALGEDFERVYKDVAPILQRQPGYLSDRLYRAIERPEEYILEVEWESVADHKRFIAAPDYPDLDGALGAFVIDGDFAHYNQVA